MKKNIAISKETREKIAKLRGVTERTVFNALDLDRPGNRLHKVIRKDAMENGGVVMVYAPEAEMIHFADGTMYQPCANGAHVEFYRSDGTGHIFYRGKEVARFENVTIPMIYEIRAQAAALK